MFSMICACTYCTVHLLRDVKLGILALYPDYTLRESILLPTDLPVFHLST